MWAQNFLDVARHSYSEVTPSGTGCRIWGLANGDALHKKFSFEIDGKVVAVELFRRTNKALTVTGHRLDTVREFANIDRVLDWALVWGERRKAAAAETPVPVEGNGFNGNGSKYSIDEIEQIVRNGAPSGENRSDLFHSIVCALRNSRSTSPPMALPAATCARGGYTKRSPEAPASIASVHCR
jgi:hypothetical protein